MQDPHLQCTEPFPLYSSPTFNHTRGYRDFTIVLDNVPWCFPEHPTTHPNGHGQCAPPRDPREWHDFVAALCAQLEALLGTETANRLRFRVGTENNGVVRFSGTHEQFLLHYQASAAAVKSVLPGAKIGPFNISGAGARSLPRMNVRPLDLARHCVSSPNPFNGAPSTPIDFIAFSRYFSPGRDLAANALGAGAAWDEFATRVPRLGDFPREIHEFDITPWGEEEKGDFVSEEYGALGAAATALMMFHLRAQGIDRLFHWEVYDTFRDRRGNFLRLFTGHAWLLSVLERAAGGDCFLLQPETAPPARTDVLGLASVKPGETLLVFTACNRDTANHTPGEFRFRIPSGAFSLSGRSLHHVFLDRTSAVHDRLRADLEAAGLLGERFVLRPDRCGGVREMGLGRKAEYFAADRLESCHAAWRDSLTLRPLGPETASVSASGGDTLLTIRLTPPQILVLVAR